MKFTAKSVVVGMSLSIMLAIVFVPQLLAKEGESGGDTTTTPSTSEPSSGSSGRTDANRTTERSRETTRSNEVEKSDSADDSTDGRLEDNPQGEARRELAREKLDDKKKAVCETRQSAVNKAMGDVVDRSKNHFDRITAIYDMTVKFYTDKELSISPYDTLIATVETTKVAALAANQQLSETPTFTCESDGPKADVQAFRNKRLDKVEAFGAYRDAVKALVKAVKAAAVPVEAAQ